MKVPDYTTLDTPELLDAYVKSEWTKDCRIDRSNLDQESAQVPELHNKFYRLFRLSRHFLYVREHAYTEFRTLRHQYWSGKLDEQQRRQFGWDPQPLKLSAPDIKEYLISDPVLHQAHESVEKAQELKDTLEEIVKNINMRNYAIKNTLDALRWSQGQ